MMSLFKRVFVLAVESSSITEYGLRGDSCRLMANADRGSCCPCSVFFLLIFTSGDSSPLKPVYDITSVVLRLISAARAALAKTLTMTGKAWVKEMPRKLTRQTWPLT